MQLVTLTAAEAADPAVMANIARHLLPSSGMIAYNDRPDVGAAPALPLPVLSTAVAAAATTALGTPGPLLPGAASPIALPPGPAGAAPTMSAAPSNPAAGGTVELDASGLPWDARIHAPGKGKTQANKWRKKKDLDASVVATVEAELRQLMSIGRPAAASSEPPPSSVFALGAAAAGVPIPPGAIAIPTPPVGAAAPAALPVGAAAPAPTSFADLMVWLTPLMMGNPPRISGESLNAELTELGLPAGNVLGSLAIRTDLIPAVHAALVKYAQ